MSAPKVEQRHVEEGARLLESASGESWSDWFRNEVPKSLADAEARGIAIGMERAAKVVEEQFPGHLCAAAIRDAAR